MRGTILLACLPLVALADMKITFIDARQADAAVIQIDQDSGEAFRIVVDGGDGDSDLEDNIPGLMTGDSTVELLIISHPHKDHTGALDWLINDSGKTIETIWWGGEGHDIAEFRAFRQAVDAKDLVLIRPAETTTTFAGTTDFSIRVFNNGLEFPGTAGHDFNNDSVVFQLIYEPAPSVRVTALFTGDIEGDQGEMLVNEFGTELASDIVKVPHHGSDHLFDDFPATVDARFAYVSSSGTHANHKHPRKAALDLYEAAADIFCTCDAAGTFHHITVTVNEAGTISTSPSPQPPYFVWGPNAGGLVRRSTVTPP